MIEAPFSELDYSSDCLDEFHGFTDDEDHGDGFNDAIEEEDDLGMRIASREQQFGAYSSGSVGEAKRQGTMSEHRLRRPTRKQRKSSVGGLVEEEEKKVEETGPTIVVTQPEP
jgi:hypothetical protein